eukprot:scaffold14839_cov36-Prasinocladus_malaysianus.AAC.1
MTLSHFMQIIVLLYQSEISIMVSCFFPLEWHMAKPSHTVPFTPSCIKSMHSHEGILPMEACSMYARQGV